MSNNILKHNILLLKCVHNPYFNMSQCDIKKNCHSQNVSSPSRALEEVFYAYCWMLQNFIILGTTGKRIILGGNSAGANLAVGLLHLCIKNGLPQPDSLFLAYPSLLCNMFPSPSRLMCLFDPMVMFPFLLRCVN